MQVAIPASIVRVMSVWSTGPMLQTVALKSGTVRGGTLSAMIIGALMMQELCASSWATEAWSKLIVKLILAKGQETFC